MPRHGPFKEDVEEQARKRYDVGGVIWLVVIACAIVLGLGVLIRG